MARPVTWICAAILMHGVVACQGSEDGGRPPTSIASTSYPGIPSDRSAPPGGVGGPSVIWRGTTLDLTLWGSGSCPAVPVALEVPDPATVEIAVDNDYGGLCTADMAARTWVLEVPATVREAPVLTVLLRWRDGESVVLVASRR
jgi:hypothetical protein